MTLLALRPLNHSAVRLADDMFYDRHPEYVVNGRRIPLSECQRRDGRSRVEWITLYARFGGNVVQSNLERCRPIPVTPPLGQCASNRGILVVQVTRASHPQPEAYVEIVSGGQTIGSGYTGADARVRFELPPGNYQVIVEADWSRPVSPSRQFAVVSACEEVFLEVRLWALTRPNMVRRIETMSWSYTRVVERGAPSFGSSASGVLRGMVGSPGSQTYIDVPDDWVVVKVIRRFSEFHRYSVIQTHRESTTIEYTWGFRTDTVELVDFHRGSPYGGSRETETSHDYPRDEIWNHVRSPYNPLGGQRIDRGQRPHTQFGQPVFRRTHTGASRKPVGSVGSQLA